MDYKQDIYSYYQKLQQVIQNLDWEEINKAMNAIVDTYAQGSNIYIMGNGGSAATASHYVCDFNKGISDGREKKFLFHCLNDNIPTMMAIANDIGYEEVFSYQLQGRLKKDDLVIAISGSGNSKNIIAAVQYAKEIGTPVVGISGFNGGSLYQMADYHMHVPVNDMQIAEDIHMTFDHMMVRVFCERI